MRMIGKFSIVKLRFVRNRLWDSRLLVSIRMVSFEDFRDGWGWISLAVTLILFSLCSDLLGNPTSGFFDVDDSEVKEIVELNFDGSIFRMEDRLARLFGEMIPGYTPDYIQISGAAWDFRVSSLNCSQLRSMTTLV